MLIYANSLELQSPEDADHALHAVARWLGQKTKTWIEADDLRTVKNDNINGAWIRCFPASELPPETYSILFTHPDVDIPGRQWVTELSIQKRYDSAFFSLLLETSDISTQIKTVPETTRPRLIQFISNKCKVAMGIPGMAVQHVQNDYDHLRALAQAIEHPYRRDPVVLVSRDHDGYAYVDIDRLQEQLFGLAQVVDISRQVNSYDLERLLTRKRSAWGGAINVIFPPITHRRGGQHIRNRLFLTYELDDLIKNQHSITSEVISTVTHWTNMDHKKRHIAPSDARLKRARDRQNVLRDKLETASEANETEREYLKYAAEEIEAAEEQSHKLVEDYKHQLEQSQLEEMRLEEEFQHSQKRLRREERKNEQLLHQLQEQGAKLNKLDISEITEDVASLIEGSLSPENCLRILEAFFPDKVQILDSAFSSAKDSCHFDQSERLLALLWKLPTEFVSALKEGGTNEARRAFTTNEYSPTESESVQNNAELRRYRLFKYKGDEVEMLQHLKIGISDDPVKTIRVHFCWDGEDDRIVIGYCGPHLPVASHKK
ncbi:hypothetical protein [Salinisphaera sp. PC39]|uniref:hypothetical protein n=1 Tax=Salinisphaera sp. PC39 TaxID=1304156 RepID=UPI00333EDC1A